MAGKHNLRIEQGATFSQTFTWKIDGVAVNLTGYTARAQIRAHHDSTTPLVSLTNGSGLTLEGAAGTVQMTISAASTAALSPGDAVWDLELVSGGGTVTRLLEGKVKIVPEVTR